MMYFYFFEDIRISKGTTKSLVYNIKNGTVLQISNTLYEILDCLNKGMDIETVCDNPILLKNSLEYLIDKKIGDYTSEKKHNTHNSINAYNNRIKMLWLKITEACNYKCIHCYDECNFKLNENSISLDKYVSVVRDLHFSFGVDNVQLIGGEPLLKGKEFVFSLIGLLKTIGIKNIEIFTNCSLIDDEYVNFLRENSVSIATSLYSQHADVHDKITTVKGSYLKTLTACKKLIECGVNLRIASTIMKENQEEITTIEKWVRKTLMINNSGFDIVRPIGRAVNKKHFPVELFNQYRAITNKNIAIRGFKYYDNNMKYNSCWGNKLCIDYKGNLYPCIMSNTSFGTIKNAIDLWTKETSPRFLHNDKITSCKECEFRYSCLDCRAMSESVGLISQPYYCSYCPEKGVWKNKIDLAEVIYE